MKNLAADTHRSADGKSYTIKIRTDGVFLDGQPVTAEDVAFSYNYIIQNDLGAFTQYTAPVTEIRVVDAATVEMKLSEAINRAWLEQNTFLWVPVLPRHIWSGISKEAAVGQLALDKLIGSGPFTISEFESGSLYSLDGHRRRQEKIQTRFRRGNHQTVRQRFGHATGFQGRKPQRPSPGSTQERTDDGENGQRGPQDAPGPCGLTK